jgi:hypothetical protein
MKINKFMTSEKEDKNLFWREGTQDLVLARQVF